ncbi:uncharacterized protein LOC111716992, partial [Eurytemora carolleeae]|uniref:uncharacterized protein LOC111716992 n=1 Tax=Eurytemora carolleeae TaxID=1294199 RepID=UPI000C7679EB
NDDDSLLLLKNTKLNEYYVDYGRENPQRAEKDSLTAQQSLSFPGEEYGVVLRPLLQYSEAVLPDIVLLELESREVEIKRRNGEFRLSFRRFRSFETFLILVEPRDGYSKSSVFFPGDYLVSIRAGCETLLHGENATIEAIVDYIKQIESDICLCLNRFSAAHELVR